jgi:dTDP-4-amino-4,6-dideoxygalactose transaminase
MSIPFFDLKKQYENIQSEIDDATKRVYQGGWFILGPEVEAFEHEFAQYIGAQYGIGVGSGTEALHLALLALGIGLGDEVITVPNTAVATVSAIELTGAKPVLVDVRADSMTMDPAQIEAAMTPHTRAIIPVHLFGQSADLGPILQIARAHQLAVVEDCAQAHGATYRGKRVGTFGDIAAFSFYPTKNLGAYGDGGIILTNDAQLADRVRLTRQYGWRERYASETTGLNSRLDELQAAILRVKLRHLDEWNHARRERAAIYSELLPNQRVRIPVEMPYGEHVYHLYVVQSEAREELAEFLKARGVGTAIQYPIPIHQQRAYTHLTRPAHQVESSTSVTRPSRQVEIERVGAKSRQGAMSRHLARDVALTVSEKLAREILSLPLYPELPLADVQTVAEAIRAFEQA